METIYESLFNIMKENLQCSHSEQEIYLKADAFGAFAECEPGIVELEKLRHLDNDSFIQALYYVMYFRTIDEPAYEFWKTKFDMPQEEFQNLAVKKLRRSVEFCYSGNKIKGDKSVGKIRLWIETSLSRGMAWVYVHIFTKLPQTWKENIKRIVRG